MKITFVCTYEFVYFLHSLAACGYLCVYLYIQMCTYIRMYVYSYKHTYTTFITSALDIFVCWNWTRSFLYFVFIFIFLSECLFRNKHTYIYIYKYAERYSNFALGRACILGFIIRARSHLLNYFFLSIMAHETIQIPAILSRTFSIHIFFTE